MTDRKPVVVLVDDEDDLREPTAYFLRERGFDVREADGGGALDRLLADVVPTILVLDVSMPEEDGLSIAQRLRTKHPHMGIIMLTARANVIDRILGLQQGADDYLVKPFEPHELVARIHALVRRLSPAAPENQAAEAEPPGSFVEEFWASTPQGQTRIGVEMVDWIEAARDYAILHCGSRAHMVRVTMTELEEGLDPDRMIRVHRSAFVNRGRVAGLSKLGRHTNIRMDDGSSLRVGPQYVGTVRAALRP